MVPDRGAERAGPKLGGGPCASPYLEGPETPGRVAGVSEAGRGLSPAKKHAGSPQHGRRHPTPGGAAPRPKRGPLSQG